MRYSAKPKNVARSCKAQGVDIRVSYKNTWNVGQAIKGMTLAKARTYLENVLEKKDIIPFRKYYGSIGRHAQAKKYGTDLGRWPQKSCKVMLGILQNAESNAEFKNLDTENVVINHVCVQRAPKGRRRTYRAHGRIGPYQSSPCHIEMICEEEQALVDVGAGEVSQKKTAMKKKKLVAGGDDL